MTKKNEYKPEYLVSPEEGGVMDIKEAQEWMKGFRSTVNMIPQDPLETWEIRIAQADAAKIQQAYWVLKAYKDSLI